MHTQLLFIGTTELLLIGGIALLLFGGKKLPEMMRGLGQGVREFKKGVKDVKSEIESDENSSTKMTNQTEVIKTVAKQMKKARNEKLPFGGHLEVLRQMLFRILGITGIFASVVFCFKDLTWKILLAPSESDFCTYRWIEKQLKL